MADRPFFSILKRAFSTLFYSAKLNHHKAAGQGLLCVAPSGKQFSFLVFFRWFAVELISPAGLYRIQKPRQRLNNPSDYHLKARGT